MKGEKREVRVGSRESDGCVSRKSRGCVGRGCRGSKRKVNRKVGVVMEVEMREREI